MDNKRTRLSQSNIEEIEEQTITRLVGNRNRYEVPVEFRGRQSTVWEDLHAQFPAPPHVEEYVQRIRLARPRFDCFLPPSYTCICYKCATFQEQNIPYLHTVMEESLVHDGAYGVAYPSIALPVTRDLGIVYALDMISHVAHFYSNYIDVPGVSYVQDVPITPQFTRVHMKRDDAPDTAERDATSKRIRRMRMTPVKLFF